jgi:hypothetical protein
MIREICGLCGDEWSEGHDCDPSPQNPNITYGHRLAIMLECALLDPVGSWNDAHALLDEYREANRQWNKYLEKHL